MAYLSMEMLISYLYTLWVNRKYLVPCIKPIIISKAMKLHVKLLLTRKYPKGLPMGFSEI